MPFIKINEVGKGNGDIFLYYNFYDWNNFWKFLYISSI